MLLSSVIIILREVLEAAMLISVLLALTTRLTLPFRWVGWSFLGGAGGAVIYAACVDAVSGWFDGVGQEVSNALLQLGIYAMLVLVTMLLLNRMSRNNNGFQLAIPVAMAAAISLAMTREGFEIIIYLSSLVEVSKHAPAVIMGAVIGASIGVSVGVLCYYLLRNLPGNRTIHVSIVLLMLVAAGMSSQAALLLIQADWLPAQLPLWDSSGWLPETSVTGQVLYALVGYEATPTPVQAGFYAGGMGLFMLLTALAWRTNRWRGIAPGTGGVPGS